MDGRLEAMAADGGTNRARATNGASSTSLTDHRKNEEPGFASERVERVLAEHESEQATGEEQEPINLLPWRFDVDRFERLVARMRRKLAAWTALVHDGLGDTQTPRELDYDPLEPKFFSPPEPIVVEENGAGGGLPIVPDSLRAYLSLCLCVVFGNGARSFAHALDTYRATGLLQAASEAYVMYLQEPGEDEREQCWRTHAIEEHSNLTDMSWQDYRWPATHINSLRDVYMRTGKAFASCAMRCRSEHVIFLEDDWEIITRPADLVIKRLQEGVRLVREQKADMVHLRHKRFYGPPYYEMLTSAQHNEPPPTSLALYFTDDPVFKFYNF